MSEGLDFSQLSDDQIVALASGLALEALRRKPAVAAALEKALATEQERVQAAMRGAQAGKQAQLHAVHEINRRAAHEQAREELRQHQRKLMAVFVRKAAEITGRALHDVTLVWTETFTGASGHRLYLNAGATGDEVTWHLINYCPKTESLRVGWMLEQRKAGLLLWAREAAAAAKALGLNHITVKGIDL